MTRKKLTQRAIALWLLMSLIGCSLLYAEQIRRQYWENDREFHRIFSGISAVLTQNEAMLPLLSGDEEIATLQKKFPLILALEKTTGRALDGARVEPSGSLQYWLYNPWRQIRVLVNLAPLMPENHVFKRLDISLNSNEEFSHNSTFWQWQERFSQHTQPFTLLAQADPDWFKGPLLPFLLTIVLLGAIVGGGSAMFWQWQQRKQADRRARYYQHARLNTLGEITAGIVHEINQPLTAAQTWIQGAQRLPRQEKGEEVAHALASALMQTQRIAELLRRFRDRVIHDEVELEAVDLLECWQHVGNLLAHERASEAIALRHEFSSDARKVWADRLWLEQVLHNLLSNAIQAQQETQQAWVCIRSERRDEKVEITVTDGGPGFSPDALQQGLMPFYSGRLNGTGLGLTLTESLILRMNGFISLANQPQGGAQVILLLPCVNEAADD